MKTVSYITKFNEWQVWEEPKKSMMNMPLRFILERWLRNKELYDMTAFQPKMLYHSGIRIQSTL
jgi:hypothetical protein